MTVDAAGTDAARLEDAPTPPGIDAGAEPDAAPEPGTDAGPAIDAFVPPDAFVAPDAAVVVPPASGHLQVLTGTSQRIVSYQLASDGTPTEIGVLDCYHQGRAITARTDGRGVFLWTIDGFGWSEFQTFTISSGIAGGPGFTLDIGGASLLPGAPIALTADGRFVYAGYTGTSGPNSAQARAGIGAFTLLMPFAASLPGSPGGMAASIANDRVFVSTPASDQLHALPIATDGTLGGGPAITACASPGVIVAHPILPILYVSCGGSDDVRAFAYDADGTLSAVGAPSSVGAAATDLILEAAGGWLLSLSEASSTIELHQILDSGAPMHRGAFPVGPMARGLSFDASQSRVYVVTTTTLDEHLFDRASATLTMRSSTPLSVSDGQALTSTP